MHINPYLFILPRSPGQIVWNYKQHQQFELDLEYSVRLAQLVNNPNNFDSSNPIDINLLNSGLLIETAEPPLSWGWDELSRIFHIGTQNIPCGHVPQDIEEWSRHYLEHCTQVLDSPAPAPAAIHGPLIDLPAVGELPEVTLRDSLMQRKTCRSFTGEALSLNDLGTLLYLSLGYLQEREDDTDETIAEGLTARRSSPSGGGLNACEGFVLVQNVDGLEPGLYRYHPAHHALSPIHPLPEEPLGLLLCGQHFINNLPLGLFISARFDRLWWKYPHSRAYRMAYVEAGHIAQTFQLVATGLGLKTWLTGALTDDRVEALLGLQNNPEQALFFVGCGHSDGQAMCEEMRALLASQEQPA